MHGEHAQRLESFNKRNENHSAKEREEENDNSIINYNFKHNKLYI